MFGLTSPSATASIEKELPGNQQWRWRTLDFESELDITASALLVNVRVLLARKATLLFQDGSPTTAIFYWFLWTINPLLSGIQWWMVMWVSTASMMKPGEEDTGCFLGQFSAQCEPSPPSEKSWIISWWWDVNCVHPCVQPRLGKLFLLCAYPLQRHPRFSFDISLLFWEMYKCSISFLLRRFDCRLFTGQEESSQGERGRQVKEGKCSLNLFFLTSHSYCLAEVWLSCFASLSVGQFILNTLQTCSCPCLRSHSFSLSSRLYINGIFSAQMGVSVYLFVCLFLRQDSSRTICKPRAGFLVQEVSLREEGRSGGQGQGSKGHCRFPISLSTSDICSASCSGELLCDRPVPPPTAMKF